MARQPRGAGHMRGRMPDSFVDQPARRSDREEALLELEQGLAADEDLIDTIDTSAGQAVVQAAAAGPAEPADGDGAPDIAATPERPAAQDQKAFEPAEADEE